MTILLYDQCELEERASKHLKAWKAWHIVIFVLAAVFGIMNYVFLQNTTALVDSHCVFYPRELVFKTVGLSPQDINSTNDAQLILTVQDEVENGETKREVTYENTIRVDGIAMDDVNMTIFTDNTTQRVVLDTLRTLFETDTDCLFAEYMPVLSTVFACVWITMFTMCAGGGHVRNGLTQPWRILAPALLFALVLVGLTGRSFTITNGGLHAFCADFFNVTNSTKCSSVNPLLELGWNASWGFGGRASATRASSAGVWASWACAAALLLARCLVAPDFAVRRTAVYLTKDPHHKLSPYLKKRKSTQRSNQNSPTKRDKCDNTSVRSDPTVTTELVTASVEHEDSAPTSLMATPQRAPPLPNTEHLEMTYSPRELTRAS